MYILLFFFTFVPSNNNSNSYPRLLLLQSFLDVYNGSPLPIEVKKGTIGRISLTVPYSSFFTQPVVINIEVV